MGSVFKPVEDALGAVGDAVSGVGDVVSDVVSDPTIQKAAMVAAIAYGGYALYGAYATAGVGVAGTVGASTAAGGMTALQMASVGLTAYSVYSGYQSQQMQKKAMEAQNAQYQQQLADARNQEEMRAASQRRSAFSQRLLYYGSGNESRPEGFGTTTESMAVKEGNFVPSLDNMLGV